MLQYQGIKKVYTEASSARDAGPTRPYLYRNIKRGISHQKFVNEALSWKGYDIALVELTGVWQGSPPRKTVVAPACLPDKGFMADVGMVGNHDQKIAVAGYGPRKMPICFTDLDGIGDNFGVCEVSPSCHYRTDKQFHNCNPSFTVGDKKYDSCSKAGLTDYF